MCDNISKTNGIHLHAYINSLSTLSSADDLCKQFVPRLGPTKRWAWPGSKLFDTVITPDLFFEKYEFEKINRRQKA